MAVSLEYLTGKTIHQIARDANYPHLITVNTVNNTPLLTVDIQELWGPDNQRFIDQRLITEWKQPEQHIMANDTPTFARDEVLRVIKQQRTDLQREADTLRRKLNEAENAIFHLNETEHRVSMIKSLPFCRLCGNHHNPIVACK